MWKTQLKIQFAIPFEKSLRYSSILYCLCYRCEWCKWLVEKGCTVTVILYDFHPAENKMDDKIWTQGHHMCLLVIVKSEQDKQRHRSITVFVLVLLSVCYQSTQEVQYNPSSDYLCLPANKLIYGTALYCLVIIIHKYIFVFVCYKQSTHAHLRVWVEHQVCNFPGARMLSRALRLCEAAGN